MSDFQTVMARSCDELPLCAWNMLCGTRQPFTHVRWLRLLEKIITNYQPRYMQIWQGDRLVAGIVYHAQHHFHLSAHLSSSWAVWGATQLLKFITPLSCLLPLYAYPGIVIDPNTKLEQILPVLAGVLTRVQKEEQSHLLSINPVSVGSQPNIVNWAGFNAVPIVADAVLDIDWATYDAYQMWLPAKKRAEIRRVRNRAADAGVTVEVRPFAASDEERIEELIKEVMTHHSSSYMFAPNLLEKTAAILTPDDYRHMVAIHEGEIIGTLTLFISEGVALVRLAGLAYERTKKTYAYHLLMSETVRLAIEMNARQLKLGGTVFTLKKQLGAHLEDRVALLKMRTPLPNRAMSQVLNWWQNRSP